MTTPRFRFVGVLGFWRFAGFRGFGSLGRNATGRGTLGLVRRNTVHTSADLLVDLQVLHELHQDCRHVQGFLNAHIPDFPSIPKGKQVTEPNKTRTVAGTVLGPKTP